MVTQILHRKLSVLVARIVFRTIELVYIQRISLHHRLNFENGTFFGQDEVYIGNPLFFTLGICLRRWVKGLRPLKNRKINITFGVLRVIPSYLVRMEHIWHVFGKNKNFDEKIFFRSQNPGFRSEILIEIRNFVIEKIYSHQLFYFFQHVKYAPSSPNMKI